MSESEKNEKKNGDIVVSGSVGIPAGNAPALPAKNGGKIRRMVNAGKKLAQTLGAFGDYAGGLTQDAIESGQMAARGYAMKKHSEGVAAFVDAYAKLSEQFGAEKAQELIGMTPESIALRRQAGTRMLQMEEQRQKNINAVARQAEQKLPEEASAEPVKQDWMARFVESVKDVSDETMQSMWSSILAGEVATPGQTSLRTLDILKNLSQQEAREFSQLLRFALAGVAVYYPGDGGVGKKIFSYSQKIHMQEAGLIHHEPNMQMKMEVLTKTQFWVGTFMFSTHSPSDDFPRDNLPILTVTMAGREIAKCVPAQPPEIWYVRALAEFFANQKMSFSAFSPFPVKHAIPQERFHIPQPSPEDVSNISPAASDDEIRAILQNCPNRVEIVK